MVYLRDGMACSNEQNVVSLMITGRFSVDEDSISFFVIFNIQGRFIFSLGTSEWRHRRRRYGYHRNIRRKHLSVVYVVYQLDCLVAAILIASIAIARAVSRGYSATSPVWTVTTSMLAFLPSSLLTQY